MGEHLAEELMRELVHGVEWGELATEENVVATRETLRTEIASLRSEMHEGCRRQTLALAGLMAAMTTAGWAGVAILVGLG